MNFSFTIIYLIMIVGFVIASTAIYYLPKIISFLLVPDSGSMKPESSEDTEDSSHEKIDSKRVKVKTDRGTRQAPEKSSKKGGGLLSRLNPFGGKKKCNDCGTELEYREEYQSYYCPECRTYK